MTRLRSRFQLGLACLAALFIGFAPRARAAEDAMQQYLRVRIETLELSKGLSVDGVELSATLLIPKLYQHTQFKPVWTQPKKVDELLRAIEDMRLDGLDPNDYHLERLKQLRAKVQTGKDPLTALELDLLLTDALARVIYHAHFGKVDPERFDDSWNIENEWKGKRGPAALIEFINSPSLYDAIEGLKPQRPMYRKLREALARYRALQEAGAWLAIPAGKTIALGGSDPRVVAIRHRLALTGDLAKSADNGSETFDDELLIAVERFQQRHDLPIGKLDAATVRTLNLPPKVWVDQLRVNLERARWIMPVDDAAYVLVNIAAFEIYYIKDHKRVWSNEAQVGRTFSKTPLFRDEIKYFVLNPTWTVPPGVLAETVLPGAQKDPRYIRERGLHVFDDTGHEVKPESVEWRKFDATNLPYRLTQDPGNENALGAIKFMFPNEHHVYLHDTPNKLGYDARVRTMSWGCIHVKDPLELAAHVVADTKWNLAAIQAQVTSGKTETVYLTKPVPVYLLYWTAEVTEDGLLKFHPDVYQRDRTVLSLLNKAPRRRKDARRGDEEAK